MSAEAGGGGGATTAVLLLIVGGAFVALTTAVDEARKGAASVKGELPRRTLPRSPLMRTRHPSP